MSTSSRSRSRSPMDGSDSANFKDDKPIKPRSHDSLNCRIYVANIPYELKWQELKDFFRSEVGDVSFVEMFSEEDGRPRGCAVVAFDSPELAHEALDKVQKAEIKGRKLVLRMREDAMRSRDFSFLFNDSSSERKFGSRDSGDRRSQFNRGKGMGVSNYSGSNQGIQNNIGNTYGLAIPFLDSLGITGPLVSKVFVSNLDFKVRDEDLREVFKIAGKVTSAEVVKDQEGKSRGFGIVEYDHPVQAVQAISMLNNQIYFDRRLLIRMDRVAEKEQIKGPRRLPPGLKSLGMGLGSNGQPIFDPSDLKNSPCADNSGGMVGGNQGMLNLGTGVESLAAMALGLGAQNMFNMGGMNSGGGFANQIRNSVAPPPPPPPPGPGPMNNGFKNTTPGTGVQIYNLPFDYSWKNLKDMCRSYGDVKFAEIKNKGEGWVRFSTESDARKAQEALCHHRIDGRCLNAIVV